MTPRNPEGGHRARPPLRLQAPIAAVAALAALALAALAPGLAMAHGGEAALFVERDTVQPGGTVVVRGEDLGDGATVTLVLAGPDGGTVELARVPADADGHVEVALAIPPDLPAATWTLTAAGDGGGEASLLLRVEGPPILPEPEGAGGQGGRDEDDPLLVALPPGWQRSLSSPPVLASPIPGAAAPAPAPVPASAGSGLPLVTLAVAAVLVVAATTVAAARMLGRRP